MAGYCLLNRCSARSSWWIWDMARVSKSRIFSSHARLHYNYNYRNQSIITPNDHPEWPLNRGPPKPVNFFTSPCTDEQSPPCLLLGTVGRNKRCFSWLVVLCVEVQGPDLDHVCLRYRRGRYVVGISRLWGVGVKLCGNPLESSVNMHGMSVCPSVCFFSSVFLSGCLIVVFLSFVK